MNQTTNALPTSALNEVDVTSLLDFDKMAEQRALFLKDSDVARPADAPSPTGRIAPTPSEVEEPSEILGGDLVPDGQFPDCCAVGLAKQWCCTGTLIAPNLVVTARHCKNMQRVFVGGGNVRKPQNGEVIAVRQQISHPIVDLSVLVLERDSNYPPRAVAQGAETLPMNNEAILMGFGITEEDGWLTYGEKRHATVALRSLDCTELPQATAAQLRVRVGFELVAGQRGLNVDTCQGDSGGPCYITSSDGEVRLLGVTSRGVPGTGNKCGDGGIYIRVDKFLDWITKETGIRISGPLG